MKMEMILLMLYVYFGLLSYILQHSFHWHTRIIGISFANIGMAKYLTMIIQDLWSLTIYNLWLRNYKI